MAFDPRKQLPNGVGDANEAFLDSLVRHQIGLLRLGGGITKKTLKILDATEDKLAFEIRRKLKNVKGGVTSANLKRLDRLQKTIAGIRNKAWDEVRGLWKEEMVALTRAEPLFMNQAFAASSVVVAPVVLPSPSALNSIVTTKPFEGKVLSEWSKEIRRADINRISNEIKIGVVQGQSANEIARSVVGTVSQRGTNGATEITRRQARAIVRTATNSMASQARREFSNENSDLFAEELYVATLDSRTTPICRSLDGKKFKIGEGAIPPVHWNCRSLRVPTMDGAKLSRRPAVASTEKQLLREYANKEGLPVVRSRSMLPRGSKGNFDKFSKVRKRELTGTVPGKVTYQQWLKRQPAAIQDDILGKSKGALFRRGNLKLDKFVNRNGDELTLKQLSVKDSDAFIAAGLDPKDFK